MFRIMSEIETEKTGGMLPLLLQRNMTLQIASAMLSYLCNAFHGKSGPIEYIFRLKRCIRTVLNFEDHRSRLQHLKRMPLPGGNMHAVTTTRRIEGETCAFDTAIVVEHHVDPPA